jgi:hypothetical protein
MPTKQLTIDETRLARINSISLKRGAHELAPNGDCEVCIVEALAYVTCQKHRDRNVTESPIIESFLRSWNDAFPPTPEGDAERDRLLKPLLPKLVNIKGGKAREDARFWMIIDWSIREFTPPWLRLIKLDVEADALASLAEITGPDGVENSMRAITVAREKSAAAWAAAWAAARDAAGDAARDAARDAAWAAAGDAAWAAARDAAGDAARDAARDAAWAAAGDAAWAAARDAAGDAAWDALKPTVAVLQESALRLIDRMIAA